MQPNISNYPSGKQNAVRWSAEEVAKNYSTFLSEKNRFCDQLEAFADRLPDGIDRQDCLLLSQNIVPLVLRAHAFEEDVVFAYLAQIPNLSDVTMQCFERLKFEHIGDEDFANDLSNALREFVTQPDRANPETLSWMLRGFFEGLRRHVAFEQALLLPLLEARRA